MAIILEPELEALLQEAATLRGVPPQQYAVAAIRAALEQDEYSVSGFADANDAPVEAAEATLLRDGILRGLEAEAAGRTRLASEVFRAIEARYGLQAA